MRWSDSSYGSAVVCRSFLCHRLADAGIVRIEVQLTWLFQVRIYQIIGQNFIISVANLCKKNYMPVQKPMLTDPKRMSCERRYSCSGFYVLEKVSRRPISLVFSTVDQLRQWQRRKSAEHRVAVSNSVLSPDDIDNQTRSSRAYRKPRHSVNSLHRPWFVRDEYQHIYLYSWITKGDEQIYDMKFRSHSSRFFVCKTLSLRCSNASPENCASSLKVALLLQFRWKFSWRCRWTWHLLPVKTGHEQLA